MKQGAADGLAAENESEAPQSGSFFIPADVIGQKLSAGDKIELSVIGTDEDGDYEVKLAGAGDAKQDWREDLKDTMSKAGEGEIE